MGVFPVINCSDFESVKKTVDAARKFLPEGNFLHCDIADAAVTFHKTWNNPTDWARLRAPYELEVHLMVGRPEREIEAWIAAGVRRFIIHVENVTDESLLEIFNMADKRGVGVVLSSNPETPVKRLVPYLKQFSMFQVLAVHPGVSGQPFLPLSLEKIKWLRRERPRAIIEVDGGMNPETAQLVKDAGANIVVSSSYIFSSPDPAAAYKTLTSI
jgi:ribulose-phosphate 3-epimerase